MKKIFVTMVLIYSSTSCLWAMFPASINSGSAIMSELSVQSENSSGYFSGTTTNGQIKATLGYLFVYRSAYQTFLNSDHPLVPQKAPEMDQHPHFVVSPDHTVKLIWTRADNTVPVHYNIYVWKKGSTPQLI